ncbi:MAG: dephospho-CoA kinase [Candidatus Nitronauta litoralis]|uniref:Dephospho-CoA kinase n=1 Tax=Candidatus Nitronauta litoralis TaxID=2705533 RepID=A0A7T0BYR0_9BACT|nr:MAG: dephospho-CoA kinase [Candidatus Nitronauta litoralis]
MALLVGVTGGMGAGKSTVSGMISRLGGHIIDADQICRRLVEPGKPAWKEIAEALGPEIVLPDQTLDRKRIAQIIFKDAEQKKKLETILHPKVFEQEQVEFREISIKTPSSVVILDAALLIESGNYRKVDKVVVVACPEEQAISRIVAQGRFAEDDARLRIRSQMPLNAKKAVADYILENDSSLEDLGQRVEKLFENLKALIGSNG